MRLPDRAALAMFVAAVVIFAASTPARAQQDSRELEAKKACLSNRPDRGIELLAELYAESNDPTYIYNQGRCYQQNGRGADALIRFREYLRKAPNLPASEKSEVERTITELEKQQQQSEQQKKDEAKPAPPPTIIVAPAPEGRDEKRMLRVAGIVAASVGVVGLGVGAYMGYRTQQLSNDVTNNAKKSMFSQSQYDDGQRAEILQWVGYGIGGVALVAGGVLYLVGTGRFGGEGGPVVAPTVTSNGGGVSLDLSF
ncbi:MAG TPA: hypothetical protein VH560_19210 [Polyangia bacterium]|nr:hypothetical protein [Polyangia bacterium]